MIALARRDLQRYFTNPAGYVFITLFILLSAAAAFWRPRFFLDNLATLDQLNEVFPYLLLFFIPAVAMGLWADERRQGTDEILLTLPLTDADVVLGKYLAALGIYSVSLLAAISHAFILLWLGRPDLGLLAASYLGYWLMGAALIPLAMIGSFVTSNAAIAFIVGAALCAIPVLPGRTPFGISTHAADFGRGLVSLDGVLYFVCLAVLVLYVNVVLLGRPRRRGTPGFAIAGGHAAARIVSVAIALACLVLLAGRLPWRADLTEERLYSLGPQTRALVGAVAADRPVIVQAFVSPEVPEPLVQTREDLLGTLREIEALGNGRITVAVQETAPYSEEARLAWERFGIPPRASTDPNGGAAAEELYLAVAVTSGGDEQVIPFFDRGLSPEYELARAIRVVSRAHRKRVGIVDTDVRILGGVDYRRNRARPAWSVVRELTRQYDVVEVTPADAADATVDALVVVLPSRMTQTDLDATLVPVRRGVPTLLLLDPLPMVDIALAPAAELASEIDPYRPAAATRVVFGDFRGALASLGINWVPASVVHDTFNPYPDLAHLPPENVFANGLLLPYPGSLRPAGDGFTFEPLLQTGNGAGSSSFFDVVQPGPGGMVLNPALTRAPGGHAQVLAARVRSQAPIAHDPGARPADVVAVADLDFISDYFFELRAAAPPGVDFDNVTFFLNAIDRLAGDDSFIALRSRRPRHRTLERVEAQTRTFVERRTREEQQAEKEAMDALAEARRRVRDRIEEIEGRPDLDPAARQVMVRTLEETENRQLRVVEAGIEQAKNAKVRASREAMEAEVRRIRTGIRTLAVALPPIPILLAGAALFVRRARRERVGARAAGRLREIV